MRFIFALFVIASFSASANWQLDQESSSLNFISTKNTDFSEMHSFDQFTGTITDNGAVAISVNLASVNTLIEIRNTRMREMLFKVGEFATADLTAQLPESVLNLKQGQQESIELQGTLSLHGIASQVVMQVRVAKLDATTYSAHTVKPIIINANQYGLKEGVAALQKIAGLTNISLAVPVSFSVVFER